MERRDAAVDGGPGIAEERLETHVVISEIAASLGTFPSSLRIVVP